MHAKTIRDDFQSELVQIEQQHEKLQKNIGNLSTERGLEAEIRDRYRVVKEGEQMILIVDNLEEKELGKNLQQDFTNTTFQEKVKGFFRKEI